MAALNRTQWRSTKIAVARGDNIGTVAQIAEWRERWQGMTELLPPAPSAARQENLGKQALN